LVDLAEAIGGEVMAKKAPAVPAKKAPAKRKPRPKKPAVPITDPTDYGEPVVFPAWLTGGIKAIALLTIGVLSGIYAAGGIEIGSDVRPGPVDAVSQAWDEYEKLWRAVQVRCAEKLESGEFTTSQQVTQYRSLADGEAIKASRQEMLKAEFADHGGEGWTAEKAAKYLRGYAR